MLYFYVLLNFSCCQPFSFCGTIITLLVSLHQFHFVFSHLTMLGLHHQFQEVSNKSNATVRAIGNTDTLLVSLLMDKLKQMKCTAARICSMDILSTGLLSHFWASSMQQTITSNASLSGWGALCKGAYTGSTWSEQEPTMHINSLELLEATLALKAFLKDTSGPLVLL